MTGRVVDSGGLPFVISARRLGVSVRARPLRRRNPNEKLRQISLAASSERAVSPRALRRRSHRYGDRRDSFHEGGRRCHPGIQLELGR